MKISLDLTHPEYMRYKKKYPIQKDEEGYYFESQNPYVSNGFGLCIGLPAELEEYVIYEDSE